MKYAWIRQHRDLFPVTSLCKVLEVTTSGYYAWVDRPESLRAQRRTRIQPSVRLVQVQSYRLQQLTAHFRRRGVADGADDCRIEAGRFPGGFGRVEQVVHCVVLPVGPVMAAQGVPQVFDRIQFWRVRRQRNQRDVRWAGQVA